MKKLTILKIYVVALLIIATFIPFGSANIIIPIASLLLIPTLACEDYQSDKIKNISKLFATFLILSLLASIIGLNLYVGVLVTFVVAFVIYYFYTYDNKKSRATYYMLYYILILSIPIDKHEIILRFSACIYGGIIVILLYYILSKIDFLKLTDSTVETAYDNLSRAILLKIQGDNYSTYLLNALSQSISVDNILVRKIYSMPKNTDALIKKELTLDLMKSLGSIINKTEDPNLLRDISRLLNWIIKLYQEKIDITEFKKSLSTHIYLSSGYENELVQKHISAFLELYQNEVLTANEKHSKRYVKKVLKKYNSIFNLGLDFKVDMASLRFNIAIKGTLLITIATFVVYYFNISNGRWILYTIIATYIPFTGTGMKKIRAKILGTVLGFILLNLVLVFVDSKLILLGLILASGYLAIYLTSYSNQAIFVTFCVVASDSLFIKGHTGTLIVDKLVFILIGGLLSYIVTKYVYPIKVKEQVRNIYKSYVKLNEEILKNVREQSLEELFNEMQNGKKVQTKMSYTEILIVYRILVMKSRFLSNALRSKYAQRFDMKEALIVSDYKHIARIEEDDSFKLQTYILPTYNKTSLVEEINEFKKPLTKKKKSPKTNGGN